MSSKDTYKFKVGDALLTALGTLVIIKSITGYAYRNRYDLIRVRDAVLLSGLHESTLECLIPVNTKLLKLLYGVVDG